jgi:hypothetical protein
MQELLCARSAFAEFLQTKVNLFAFPRGVGVLNFRQVLVLNKFAYYTVVRTGKLLILWERSKDLRLLMIQGLY